MKVNKETFFKKTENFNNVPFSQSTGYFDLKFSHKNNYAFFLNEQLSPSIGCYAREIKIPVVGGRFLHIESICYDHFESEKLIVFLEQLINYDYKIINIVDDNIYSPILEIAFRTAEFRRPIGQFGTSLSILINLNNELNYSRSWKRNIKIAKKNGDFTCKNIINFDEKIIDEIAVLFKENSQIKKLSYCYSKHDLFNIMKDPKWKLFVAQINNKIVAARVIYTNDKIAYDFTTANGHKSREIRGVTHALVDYIFDFLKKNDFNYFDFSRLPISRKGAEGVSEFKLGSRGDIIKYNGEWIYTKKSILRWVIYLMNKFVRKKYEY